MRRIFAILIATSLSANAWLAIRISSNNPRQAPLENTNAAATSSDGQSTGAIPLRTLETADAATCRDELRGAGRDDAMTRAIIDGILRQRFREQLKSLRIKRQAAWWRTDGRSTAGEDNRLLNEIVLAPLREVMGRDLLDVSDAEKRYDFLSPAKRRLLAEIAVDYEELGATGAGWISENTTKLDIDRQRLLADERRNDVLAALTPAERAEYDLRFEGSAGLLSGRLAAMNGTEQEFRALRPLLDGVRQRSDALVKDEGFAATFAEFNQRELDNIAAAIGADRALDYQWSGPGLYVELVRFSDRRGLPPSTAARVMQLAAETGLRASVIHHDAAISGDEKRAALERLQAEVAREFDQLVPAPMRVDLPEQAIDWFRMLANGRYMGFIPSLLGTGTGVTKATAVSQAVGGRAWLPPPRPRVRHGSAGP